MNRNNEDPHEWEEASPGEIKSGGAGRTLYAGVAVSPFGSCLIAECPRGLCHFSFFEEGGEAEAWIALEGGWPNARMVRDDGRAAVWCARIFMAGQAKAGTRPLKLYVKGTPFQVRVWRALLQVPEGALVSYGALAALIGNPKASRAVGRAVGNNPIGFLIPCHRVIRESGVLGGYAWGVERKKAIQVWEQVRSGRRR